MQALSADYELANMVSSKLACMPPRRRVTSPLIDCNGAVPHSVKKPRRENEVIFAVLLYIVFWNIDLSILFGGIGGQLVAIGRWIAIASIFLLALRDISSGRDIGALLPIVVLMSLLCPSIIFSNDQFYSVVEFARIISLFLIFWLLRSRAHIVGPIYSLIGVFAICTVVGSLPYLDAYADLPLIGGRGGALGRLRDAGLATHPNNFGFISNIAISYILSQSFRPRRIPMVLRVVVLTIGIVSLFLSDSRTAQIELVTIFGAFSYFYFVERRPKAVSHNRASLRRALLFIGFMSVVSVPAVIVAGGIDTSRLVSNDSFGESNAARLSIWQRAFSEFLENPLTGVGLGGQIRERYNPIENEYVYAPYAHNGFLNALYVAGIAGGLWFLLLINAISFILLSALMRRSAWEDEGCLFLFVTVVVMTIISAVIEGGLQNNYGLNSFLAISLGVLSPRLVKRSGIALNGSGKRLSGGH